jgi:hypothetical protein
MGSELIPLVRSLIPEPFPVYWFMGDLGHYPGRSLLIDQDPDSGFHFVATGIGGRSDDHAVRVTISESGGVQLDILELGSEPPTLEQSRLEHWLK